MNEQQIVETYIAWCRDHGIKNVDGTQDKVDNANLVWKYMTETWPVEFTRDNLDLALPALRPHLKFFSPVEAEYQRYASQLAPEQASAIAETIRRRGLNVDGDTLFANFVSVASYLAEKKFPITVETIDRALGNIVGGRRPLIWNKKLQDSERANLKARETAAKTQPRPDNEVPSYVPSHLREHYRMMHQSKPEPLTPTNPKSEDSMYRQRALDAVASISSVLDRAEAERLLQKSAAHGWEITFKTVMRFIEKRSQERWLAGKAR